MWKKKNTKDALSDVMSDTESKNRLGFPIDTENEWNPELLIFRKILIFSKWEYHEEKTKNGSQSVSNTDFLVGKFCTSTKQGRKLTSKVNKYVNFLLEKKHKFRKLPDIVNKI